MSIVKRFQTNFTITDNRVAQCKELSITAKGLYFYIASLPDDWAFAIERIARANNISEQATRKALKELEAIGLLTREMKNGGDRHGTKWEYTIYDFETAKNNLTPDDYQAEINNENPQCEKSGCEISQCENTNPLQSNNIYKEINLQRNKFNKISNSVSKKFNNTSREKKFDDAHAETENNFSDFSQELKQKINQHPSHQKEKQQQNQALNSQNEQNAFTEPSSDFNPQGISAYTQGRDFATVSVLDSFMPPTLDELERHKKAHRLDVDCEAFYYHYAATDWTMGKTKIKNWKALMQKWHIENKNKAKKANSYQHGYQSYDPTQKADYMQPWETYYYHDEHGNKIIIQQGETQK